MICGKQIYSTRRDAGDAIKGLQNDSRKGRSKTQPYYSYFCKDCNGWHLASNIIRKKKIKFIQDDQNIASAKREKQASDVKSGTKNFVIHNRLNFRVK